MNRSSIDPPQPRLVHVVLLVLTLEFLLGALARPLVRPYVYSDFVTFYSAAVAFERGANPYDFAALQQTGQESFPGWVGRYLYPPPFAACVVRPLAKLQFEAARRVWVLIETGAYVGALVLLRRMVFPAGALGWLGVAALGLPFAPFRFDLHLGSVSGVLLLLVTCFMAAHARGQSMRAGLALGGAILLKLSPALIVPVLFLAGARQVLARTLLSLAALVLAALPWTGFDAYVHYGREVVPYLAQGSFTWFTNQSVDASLARLFTDNTDTTPWLVNSALYRGVTLVISGIVLAALAGVAWRVWRSKTDRRDQHAWLAAAALVGALLVARVTWEYMVVLALPCFALWLREIARGSVGRWTMGVAAVAFAACALPIPYAEHPIRSGIGLLLVSPRTYGLALLLGLTLVHVWRTAASLPDAVDASPRSRV